MKAEGLKPEEAKVLDIGCNAGGVMEVSCVRLKIIIVVNCA